MQPGGFYFLVKRSVRKRLQIIEQEFPAAIDIIVRGVRSGMPLNEGLRLVAAEAHPLIAKEFALVLDDLAVGIPLSQCIRRMAERMPIPDIQFFRRRSGASQFGRRVCCQCACIFRRNHPQPPHLAAKGDRHEQRSPCKRAYHRRPPDTGDGRNGLHQPRIYRAAFQHDAWQCCACGHCVLDAAGRAGHSFHDEF